MSRIDDLVAEHCPDGVPYRPLGDLLSYEQPTKFLVRSTQYDSSYPTPVLTAGQTFILGYTDEQEGIYPANVDNPVVIFDDFTTAIQWVDFPFKVKSSAMKILSPCTPNRDSLRFVYYALQTIGFEPGSHARHWISIYSKFRIPWPPLEVQREIVRVLDLFTSLEAELEAELEARRKQYEHYRDWLFSVEPVTSTLGAEGTFIRGNGLQKKDLKNTGFPAIHYGQIHTHYGVSATETLSYVDEEFSHRLRKLRPGDLAIATTSEDDAAVARAVAWRGTDDVAVSGDLYVYRHQFHPGFISFYFQSESFQNLKSRHITGTKVRRISDRSLAKIAVPVPSIERQIEIVDVLDRFDKLIAGVNEGIPAEIAARRKQYEYYRDKLLTFKEKIA